MRLLGKPTRSRKQNTKKTLKEVQYKYGGYIRLDLTCVLWIQWALASRDGLFDRCVLWIQWALASRDGLFDRLVGSFVTYLNVD